MGYDTDFSGAIGVSPALPQEWVDRWNNALNNAPTSIPLSSDAEKPQMLPDWPREIDGNPQPEGWCQWVLVNDVSRAWTSIEWDGNEKFYEHAEWLMYLIAAIRHDFPDSHFDGEIEWRGEDWDDHGFYRIKDGAVTTTGANYTDDEVDKLVEAARTLLATRDRMVMWEHSELRAAGQALEAALQPFPVREVVE